MILPLDCRTLKPESCFQASFNSTRQVFLFFSQNSWPNRRRSAFFSGISASMLLSLSRFTTGTGRLTSIERIPWLFGCGIGLLKSSFTGVLIWDLRTSTVASAEVVMFSNAATFKSSSPLSRGNLIVPLGPTRRWTFPP